MKTANIPPTTNGLLNVIIETPRGSACKYHYEPEQDVFLIKKMLPLGMVFPFDFGFVPNTIAGDGDPLDVLVVMEHIAAVGCLVQCRIVGLLEAEQAEEGKKKERNDRLVAIPACSQLYSAIERVNDMGSNMTHEIEQFFTDYNLRQGKTFKPLGWHGEKAAEKLVRKYSKRA